MKAPLLSKAYLPTVALLLALGGAALLAACAGSPVPPDWQSNAQDALKNFSTAYYAGNTRVADTGIRPRARRDRRHRPGRPAGARRTRALRRASGEPRIRRLPGLRSARRGRGKEERAYAAFLAGRWQGLDASLLPPQHRALLAGASDAGALAAIKDPMSRLVAAGVLFRIGRLAPDGIAAATETASANGWRRPLLAWLGVQAARADAAGDKDAAARIRRRMEIVSNEAGAK